MSTRKITPEVRRRRSARAKAISQTARFEKIKKFAGANNLTVGEVSEERRTVKLEGTAAKMIAASVAPLDAGGRGRNTLVDF